MHGCLIASGRKLGPKPHNGIGQHLDNLNGQKPPPTGDPSGLHAIAAGADKATAAIDRLHGAQGRLASPNYGGGPRTGKVMIAMRGAFSDQGMG